jgi:hypothetical protein
MEDINNLIRIFLGPPDDDDAINIRQTDMRDYFVVELVKRGKFELVRRNFTHIIKSQIEWYRCISLCFELGDLLEYVNMLSGQTDINYCKCASKCRNDHTLNIITNSTSKLHGLLLDGFMCENFELVVYMVEKYGIGMFDSGENLGLYLSLAKIFITNDTECIQGSDNHLIGKYITYKMIRSNKKLKTSVQIEPSLIFAVRYNELELVKMILHYSYDLEINPLVIDRAIEFSIIAEYDELFQWLGVYYKSHGNESLYVLMKLDRFDYFIHAFYEMGICDKNVFLIREYMHKTNIFPEKIGLFIEEKIVNKIELLTNLPRQLIGGNVYKYL